MKKIISWISFVVIIMWYGCTSVFCGALVANYLQDNIFHFSGWWCLLNFIPCFITASAVAFFLLAGLKKFGGND